MFNHFEYWDIIEDGYLGKVPTLRSFPMPRVNN